MAIVENGIVTSFASVNPASEQEIERFDAADPVAVDRCVSGAMRASREWSATGLEERLTPVRRLAHVLRSRRDPLAVRITEEMGKPITEARAEVEKCAAAAEFIADVASAALADIPVPSDSANSYVAFRPLGPVLMVMPWNFPFWQVIRAAVPLLCAGNVAVLKHAPNVFGCARELMSAFAQAGFPEGCFSNLIISADAVQDVIADQRIAAVTLTGSERAGIAVATAAGENLKRAVLELGGSDAFIVLADADIPEAAKVAAKSRFQNAGQSCIAAKRFLVEQACLGEFTEALVAEARKLAVGDPLDVDTTLGPLARCDLRDTLAAQVRETVAAGARVLTGGTTPQRAGWYFEPTVLDGVTPSMVAACDETFGPLAPIIAISDEAAAIEIANASRFGLGANVWTGDIERGLRVGDQIESGGLFINGMTHSDARLPFGGVKRSGFGRELGEFGLREFTNVKTVWRP